MRIGISIGDPNGIGIEILLKALHFISDDNVLNQHQYNIIGNARIIKEYADLLGFPVKFEGQYMLLNNYKYEIIEACKYCNVEFGKASVIAGKAAIQSAEFAVEKAIQNEFDAIVTMPISKYSAYLAGWSFTGHTEMLADKCRTHNYLMILFSKNMRVALATIHIPIKDVANEISTALITKRINQLNDCLKNDFNIAEPRIAVLGLNPHAGESHSIGEEEEQFISPAISLAQSSGIKAEGPFPADGFFAFGESYNYDGILAMYHDQGLIPLKLLAKGAGVNFTAGLPIIRTSPDHGTGFDIAGKSIANISSTIESIISTIEIAKNRGK